MHTQGKGLGGQRSRSTPSALLEATAHSLGSGRASSQVWTLLPAPEAQPPGRRAASGQARTLGAAAPSRLRLLPVTETHGAWAAHSRQPAGRATGSAGPHLRPGRGPPCTPLRPSVGSGPPPPSDPTVGSPSPRSSRPDFILTAPPPGPASRVGSQFPLGPRDPGEAAPRASLGNPFRRRRCAGALKTWMRARGRRRKLATQEGAVVSTPESTSPLFLCEVFLETRQGRRCGLGQKFVCLCSVQGSGGAQLSSAPRETTLLDCVVTAAASACVSKQLIRTGECLCGHFNTEDGGKSAFPALLPRGREKRPGTQGKIWAVCAEGAVTDGTRQRRSAQVPAADLSLDGAPRAGGPCEADRHQPQT